MTENETKIVQSCLDIVSNAKDVNVEDLAKVQIYSVYCDKKRVFTIAKDFNISLACSEYKLDIDNSALMFRGNQPDLEALYKLCKKKHIEQTQQRENKMLNFLAGFKGRQKGS